MKHFKEFIQWCCEPQRLFVLFIVVLAIPNVALFFTEQQMTLWARICNVILPVSVYWLIMTLGRKPGKTIWILFPFVFFAAFQLVLLYLFGRSIIAVDMFLNLTTTNSGEALELLDKRELGLKDMITHRIPFDNWEKAFELAEKGKDEALKVTLTFT